MVDSDSRKPRIWLILGDKLGDNAQAMIIADALGLPYEIKRVIPKEKYILGKPRFRPTLQHLDMERSDILSPPWPDLVITIGRRPAMAALWVRKQSKGNTKVALIGRPRYGADNYALVIVPPQYIVPVRENIITLDYPLIRKDQHVIEKEVSEWRDVIQSMQRPITAVFIGGPTKPFVLNRHVARDIAEQVIVHGGGGSAFIVTSRRTPKEVLDELQRYSSGRVFFYRWGDDKSRNPYDALLGAADRFVVTGDSISMMAEVAYLGKPLFIYQLPIKHKAYLWVKKYFHTILLAGSNGPGNRTVLDSIKKYFYLSGYFGYMRDITIVHDKLIEHGYATVWGTECSCAPGKLRLDLSNVVKRLRSLLNVDAEDDCSDRK